MVVGGDQVPEMCVPQVETRSQYVILAFCDVTGGEVPSKTTVVELNI